MLDINVQLFHQQIWRNDFFAPSVITERANAPFLSSLPSHHRVQNQSAAFSYNILVVFDMQIIALSAQEEKQTDFFPK